MARYNLPRVFTVTDEKGNPQGFGPGEADVPEWAVKQLKDRGRDIEAYRVSAGDGAGVTSDVATGTVPNSTSNKVSAPATAPSTPSNMSEKS